MSEVLTAPVKTPSAWRSTELENDAGWRVELTDADQRELLDALDTAESTGKRATQLKRGDFPLPALGGRLTALRTELEGGRGFQILRGLPVGELSDEAAQMLLWGIGQYIGDPEPQDKAGNLLHIVTDTGQSVTSTDNVRGFQTNNELFFHTDGADVFAPGNSKGHRRLGRRRRGTQHRGAGY